MKTNAIRALDDSALLVALTTTLCQNRALTVYVLRLLQEVDTRRLFAAQGFPSLFAFCTQKLGLSEGAAYKRIHAARAARHYPQILEMLERGTLHLSAVALLKPRLTQDNAAALLQQAQGLSKEQLHRLLARWFPEAPTPARVQRLPMLRPTGVMDAGGPSTAPVEAASSMRTVPPQQAVGAPERAPASLLTSRPAFTSGSPPPPPAPPLPPPSVAAVYRLQVTLTEQTREALRELQELLGPRQAGHDLDAVIGRAIVTLRDKVLQSRHALRQLDLRPAAVVAPDTAQEPRPLQQEEATPPPLGAAAASRLEGSDVVPPRRPPAPARYIPAKVRRGVFLRDRGRCTFVASDGTRCSARGLEYHHRQAFARGGLHSLDNITLHCAAHNRLAADHDFGPAHMQRMIDARGQSTCGPRPPATG